MFNRVLIANRGEIALRVMRACRELGIQVVAVYSEADRDAMYLRYADEAICIGPPAAAESYLNIPHIIAAAEIADVEAIHPGYGFLAENSHFAEVCESCKIRFIGPKPEVLQKVGNKLEARKTAQAARVPVLPGSDEPVKSPEEACEIAHKIGYPIMIKAVSGGGGRGMRVAHNDISLINSFHAASAEAEASFKDPSIYIEKLIENPRHVEIQILADDYGNYVYLGERDCSLQRRHQKLIEEAPSPIVRSALRAKLGRAAVRIAKAVDYSNAGTVEFLLDKNMNFYFIEMNARIQVEHPVTEMITGVDLVKQQLRIASGERLSLKQNKVRLNGVSIECRINAEDCHNGFKPAPGTIKMYSAPGGIGVRVDSHVYPGYSVSPHYDSMIAKLIVHQKSRAEAIVCMRRALDEFVIEGVKTTIPLYQEIFTHAGFVKGDFDTGFVDSLVRDQQ